MRIFPYQAKIFSSIQIWKLSSWIFFIFNPFFAYLIVMNDFDDFFEQARAYFANKEKNKVLVSFYFNIAISYSLLFRKVASIRY